MNPSVLHVSLISSQSLNLGGRRGTTDDVATIPFHPSLSSAALRESLNPIPVHSLMLSSHLFFGERGGSVVECRTPEREVGGSKPTAAVLCPWARHFTPRKYWLITQEAVAPSRHDWKIVDWDVKPQHKQINICSSVFLSVLILSLSLAELSLPCQRILRCGHTIWVSVSLSWLGDHNALQLHSGFCCEPLRSSHGLCRKCSEVSYSISSQGLGSFSRFLLSRSRSHRHKGR